MNQQLNIDELDLKLLQCMIANADRSYAEIGEELHVSQGTIHVRMKKLTELGVVNHKMINVNLKKIGFDVVAFIGVYLEKSSLYDSVASQLKNIPQIVRLNYTTGSYSMFIEIVCKDIDQLRKVLHDDLQKVKGIERTETLISLEENFKRAPLLL
jgi:Lrp/AsnC family transcriptional regulator for asnA, asnC and gidA